MSDEEREKIKARAAKMGWEVWFDHPPYNKHCWAFYHYCKRQGWEVRRVNQGDGKFALCVRKNISTSP